MKINKKDLLQELSSMTAKHRKIVSTFQTFTDEQLHFRPNTGKWTLLENIEHLNRYAEVYIPVIEKAIKQSKPTDSKIFKSGWLGNKFAVSMLPGESMTTMNTFKSKNPLGEHLNRASLETFTNSLNRLANALVFCENISLDKYTKITIPLLQIKLGDTLRVVIYHHERHMVQIAELKL